MYKSCKTNKISTEKGFSTLAIKQEHGHQSCAVWRICYKDDLVKCPLRNQSLQDMTSYTAEQSLRLPLSN